jgi:Spy/CpxP family protein refolding chaperone
MNMVRVLWVSGILLLMGASVAAQQGKGMRGMGMMGRGMQGMDDANFQPTLSRLTAMLDLSTDQAEKIRPLRDTLLTETAALRTEATAARQALRAAQQAGVGADSLATLRANVQASMKALMPARMRFHERIKSVLTPEQATRLDANHAEQMQRMQQMQTGKQSGKMRQCCMKGDSAGSQQSHH